MSDAPPAPPRAPQFLRNAFTRDRANLDLLQLLQHMPKAPRAVDVLLMLDATRQKMRAEMQSPHLGTPATFAELNGIPVESFPTLDAAVERLRELLQAGKNPLFLLEGNAIPGPTRSPTT